MGSKWTYLSSRLSFLPQLTTPASYTSFLHQVGSKWTRGVVSRVFSSPKWLTVTLESGQTRPTQRDQVILDTEPLHEQLTPSALVLASSPPSSGEMYWRKAELLEVMPETEGGGRRYRVQAEGEEQHLAADQLRLLPPKIAASKPESGAKRSRSAANPAPANPAPADPAPADPAPADGAPPESKRPCTPVEVKVGGTDPGTRPCTPGCS